MESQYIATALKNTSGRILTVAEFIRESAYPIDLFMIDRFWNTLGNNQLIYVDDELITWMGFDAKLPKHRKDYFVRLLQDNIAGSEYFEYNNSEYRNFIETAKSRISDLEKLYPSPALFIGKNRTHHLLLSYKCLRIAMMQLNTVKGKQVRAYYLTLEDLFKIYIQYQNEYKQRHIQELLQEKNQSLITSQQDVIAAKQELETKQLALTQVTEKLTECDQKLNRLGNFNQELIRYKLFIDRSETLYVVTSMYYASQGLFKVGKTKNLSARTATHNTSHPVGDEIFIAKEIKTGNAGHLERRVEHILQHFRPVDSREFYRIPFLLLSKVIDELNDDLCREEELANEIIKIMARLILDQSTIDWAEGIPKLLGPTQVQSDAPANKFDTNVKMTPLPENPADTEYYIISLKLTREEAIKILETVYATLEPGSIVSVKAVNESIRSHVKPKNKFKAKDWKQLVAEIAQRFNISLKYR